MFQKFLMTLVMKLIYLADNFWENIRIFLWAITKDDIKGCRFYLDFWFRFQHNIDGELDIWITISPIVLTLELPYSLIYSFLRSTDPDFLKQLSVVYPIPF
jgi:hypothetical protein